MDPYMEHAQKHLNNFSLFAEKFTKAFVPLVDTAIKMSNEEPVSAYSYFKAAKDLADTKKQSKKKQNGSPKNKSKVKVKKLACAPGKIKTSKQKKHLSAKNNKSNNANSKQAKKPTTKQQNTSKENFSDSGVVNLVETLYTKDKKKLTKAEEKKKKDFEAYLVNHLEMDDQGKLNGSDESLNSISSEEDSYTESDCYSDEYTINDSGSSGSFIEHSEVEGESCASDEDDQAAIDCEDKLAKTNKKRKSPETETKEKFANTNQNNLKAKKSKNVKDSKLSSRKSLPLPLKNGKSEDIKKSRSSLASLDKPSSSSKLSSTPRVKLQSLSKPGNVYKLNSIEEGKRAFEWLLNPITVEAFFAQHWERKACLIKRQQNNYYAHLISFESIDQMMLTNHVEFTKNIDVTTYKKGVRETLNPEGRALPPVVWDHYGQGCSIRLINPQTFLPPLYSLCATMQEYFHCLVGANAYLTPPNSQGFAPHYDDIEAFVLQVEGRKRWKLYKPRITKETLPRFSSPNFSQEEIGKPILDEILEPGDMLYFPRGTIHQATTEPGSHSLHITLSVYQKQSFADLFEKMLPVMLEKAIASNLDMRRGLPLNAWQHAGVAYSNHSSKERTDLIDKVKQLMHKCIRDMPLENIMDAGFDQLAKRFQHEALPPQVLPAEKIRTVFGSCSRTNERGECVCDYDIDERTNVRLLRANILHLVEEEGKIRIYYYLENSKEYCQYEPNFIEIEPEEAASVEVLIKSYPQYVGVSQLPLRSDDLKINLATALWERGLLMMEKPFR